MKRRSAKRQALIDARPVIAEISDDRTPRRPDDESFREFVRRLPCVVCRAPTLRGDPCHLHARRRFGDWLERDGELIGNIYPACRRHHGEQHNEGIESFPRARGLDLDAVCRIVGEAYRLGWSADGLGSEALACGYLHVDVAEVVDSELPY